MDNPVSFEIIDRNSSRFQTVIATSRDRVWRMLSDPTRIRLWFLPVTSMEAQLGGRYSIPAANGSLDGVLTEYDPPHIINFDGALRFELTEASAGCHLALNLKRGSTGWNPSTLASFHAMLDNLHRLLKGAAPDGHAAHEQRWGTHRATYEQAISLALAGGRTVIHRIFFDRLAVQPTAQQFSQASSAIELLTRDAQLKIVIDGFSDDGLRGAAAFRLSQQRAEHIAGRFVEAGISADRIIARAFGNAYRVGPNEDKNRRVELIPTF